MGQGVLRIVEQQVAMLQQRTGRTFAVKHVVVRDPAKHDRQTTTDLEAAVTDPAVDVVIELIGGVEAAGQVVQQALSQGKHVVTANKSLIAERGRELATLAREKGVTLAFEASCGGGVPIVAALQHSYCSRSC